jgi:hypothetical protein
MNRYFKILLFFLCAVNTGLLHGQVFPVQVTTQLVAPYSLYLSDYVSPASDRLVVMAFINDISRPELNVRFRLRIIGQGITMETRADYIPPPVSLQGGIPLRLISADLAGYFEPRNLNFQGITRREYEQRGKLPEGIYQFCFEVLEYNRGVKISNTGCATAWMILNDPPIINIPQQNEKIKPLSPQNVILQWTPRHTGSPNSAFTTEYEIRMVEVWPATRNPNDAILTSPPIFETTTRNTTIIYGPAETPLELGRRYAFRVKAKSIVGVDELDLFKNNGYSEVYTFVYGDACNMPKDIQVVTVGSNRFKIQWASQFNHTAFKVRYRQAGTQNWYQNETSINEAEINSLKPNTSYEYEISGNCGFFEGPYSTVASVKTKEAPLTGYSCGLPLQTFSLDPSQLTGSINIGDVIQAGDFDVQVTKISGGNGIFSGEGVISMSYLRNAKVKAAFTNITVNKDLRLVKGFMNVTGAGVEIIPAGVKDLMDKLDEGLDVLDSALAIAEEMIPDEIPNPSSFVADTLITIKGEILAVVKNPVTGNVVVTTTNGQTQELAPGTSYAITDSKGKGYLVDSNGNVGKTTAEVAAQTTNREYNLAVVFNESTQAKYGFDRKPTESQYTPLKGYEQLEGGYRVPWKAVASNTIDPVIAKLEKSGVEKSKIRFQQNGIDISTAPLTSDNTTTVSVKGNVAGDVEDLTAIITPSDTSKKEQLLGKLKVITYDGVSNNLVIVPVNNTKYPSTDVNLTQLKTQLNKIYSQAAVSWNVSLATKLDVTLPVPFDDGESGLLANYTGDMKTVINAYKSNFTPNTYYLFLVEKPASGKTLGFMPRSKQAGFIFVDLHGGDENLLIKTIAHELGHGAFTLHHTFSDDTPLTQGKTDNLMDYDNGTASRLYKHQWDRIHNPATVLGLFEDDAEGALFKSDLLMVSDYLIDGRQISSYTTLNKISYVTPNGKIISLSSDTKVSFSTYIVLVDKPSEISSLSKNAIGVLTQFQSNAGVVYTSKFINGHFVGYFSNNSTTPYSDISSSNEENVIIGVEFNDCKIKFMYGKYHVVEVANFNEFTGITLEGEGELIGVKAVDPTKCIKCNIPDENKPQEIKAVLETLAKNLEDSNIDDLLAKTSETQMKNFICVRERFDLINNVSQGTLVGTEDEQTIIKLFRSTPDDQAKDLIDLFKYDTSGALKELFSSIDGDELAEFFGEVAKVYFKSLGQNHQKVQETLDNSEAQFLKSTTPESCDLLYELANRNVFVLHFPQVINTSSNLIIKYEVNSLLGYGLNDDGTTDFQMSNNKCLLNTAKDFTVKPFDLVKIYYLSSDRSELTDVGYMPGYNLRWVLNNYNNTQIGIGVNKGIFITSIFTAGTTSELTVFLWSTVDAVVSYGNLFIIQNQDELSKSEEGKRFVSAWNEVNKYVFIAQGVHLLYGVGRNFIAYKLAVTDLKTAFKEWKLKSFDELKQSNPELAAKLESFGSKGIQKLDDLIAEYELQVQKISTEFNVTRDAAEKLMSDEDFMLRYSKGETINVQEYLEKISNNAAAKIGARKYFKGLTDAHYNKIDEILGDRAQSFVNEIEDNPAINIGTVAEIEALAKTKKWRLKANDTYQNNEYTYNTDKYGRIETVEGELKLDGVERHPDGPSVGQGDGKLPNDVGGHLIGRQFGGAGDATNIVAMDKTVNAYSNIGKFGQHEIRWRKLLVQNPNTKIFVKIEDVFNTGNFTIRPDAFEVTEIIDGVERSFIIPNN